MKDELYRTSGPNFTQLKRRITTTIRTFSLEILKNVWIQFETRLQAAIRGPFGHIEQH